MTKFSSKITAEMKELAIKSLVAEMSQNLEEYAELLFDTYMTEDAINVQYTVEEHIREAIMQIASSLQS